MKFSTLLAIGTGLVAGGTLARGCGPDFPNSYLADAKDEVTTLPSLAFTTELERLPRLDPAAVGTASPESGYDPAAAELAEVRTALAASGIAGAAREAALKAYDRHAPSADLPAEFQLYATGANAWNDGRPAAAIHAWRGLLDLPPAQRRFRTVWAEYMLGRALYVQRPAAAQALFDHLRGEAEHGFPDSQHLALASLGWEGRSFLAEGDYPRALRLYFQQFQEGDPSALPSLQRVARYAFLGEKGSGEGYAAGADEVKANLQTRTYFTVPACRDLSRLAADPICRGIVTAWFVARGGPHTGWGDGDTARFKIWLSALRRASSLSGDEAELWAFAAYQAGLWEEAGQFARQAPPHGGRGEWVRAMLLLRQGSIDEAASHLASAAQHFPAAYRQGSSDADDDEESPWQRLQGSQATLALRRDQFADALRIFYQAGHWMDAAFVAEQILTLDELEAFVRVEAPPVGAMAPAGDPAVIKPVALRSLLARRLMRAHRFGAAREFFSSADLPFYDAYVEDARDGFDDSRPSAQRAQSLWQAAQMIHEHGMELMGTELNPDYTIWDGEFEYPDFWSTRYHEITPDRYQAGGYSRTAPEGEAALLAPTDAELTRAFSHLPPTRRFHYRARASELAWLAAGLLPNDDEHTAEILDTAGRWLAQRDPEGANLFYKSLVTRCPHTEIGRQALQRRWFEAERPEARRLVPPSPHAPNSSETPGGRAARKPAVSVRVTT